MQAEIQNLENRKESLTGELNSGITDHVKLQEVSNQIKQIGVELDTKTLRWLELSEFDT